MFANDKHAVKQQFDQLRLVVQSGSVSDANSLLNAHPFLTRINMVDVNSTNGIMYSILHYAVSSRRKEMVELIMQHDKEIAMITDFQGQSALESAVRDGCEEIVQLLLTLNSDIIKASSGSALIMNAVIIGNENIFKILMTYPEIVKTITIPNCVGLTSLFFAENCGRYSIARLLKEALQNLEKNIAAEDFSKKCQIILETGHILGLDGDLKIKRRDLPTPTEENVSFSSGSHLSGVLIFSQCLKFFCDTLRNPVVLKTRDYFQKIQEATNTEVRYCRRLDDSAEIGIDKLLTDLKENKLVILPCSTPGHSIAFAIYKNKLIVCNRAGDYDETLQVNRNTDGGGTKIYDIDLKQVTQERLLALTTWKIGGIACSSDERELIINDITENKSPVVVLPSKCQKHDTCIFIHQKSLVEGILYVFELESSADIAAAHEYAEKTYKIFTTALRNNEVNKRICERKEILRKINEEILKPGKKDVEIENLKEELDLYNKILITILNEHHGEAAKRKEGDVERKFVPRSDKLQAEIERGKAILNSFDSKTREDIVKKEVKFSPDCLKLF